MDNLIKLLTKDAPELFPTFLGRLTKIAEIVYCQVGWGYGDGIRDALYEVCEFHEYEVQAIATNGVSKYGNRYSFKVEKKI